MINTELDIQMIYFKPETLAHFGDNKQVETQTYSAMKHLIARSRSAIAVLGEFALEEIESNPFLHECEAKEYYHPSQFKDLEYDLFMLEEMLNYMLMHEDDSNCFVGIYPEDSEKYVLAFSLGDESDDDEYGWEETDENWVEPAQGGTDE